MIVVWDLPDGPERAPILAEQYRDGVDRVEARWGDLCREIGGKHQLPDGYLQAMIWRESGGNPLARNPEGTADPSNDGIGLLQITSKGLKGNRTDEELFNPRMNLEIGARYLSWLASLPSIKGDFPKMAAAFNAGSVLPSERNEWGMVMTGDHVSAEVAAYNYWLSKRMSEDDRAVALAVAHQFTLAELLPYRGVLDTLPDGEDPKEAGNG